MIWFLSDTHFGHDRIRAYCGRSFASLKEMDETLIKNINERVDAEDTLFFLGDFCMKKSSEASDSPKNAFDYYRGQINCKNIVFIEGNHDGRNGVKSIIQSLVIQYGGKRIFMTHDPKYANEDYLINFCGHVHEKWDFQKLGKKSVIVNLSVEKWDYRPVNINEIFSKLADWKRKND
jgi:calcineurin-like phosphoesterase family protein